MTKLFKLVHNVETGEVIEVELTEQEITELNDDGGMAAKRQQEAAAKAALLDKLGITAEEAQLLLGGN
jgi:hypothetical protein